MARVFPPVCLFLAILTALAAFGLLAVEAPQASVELHQARTEGDQQRAEILDAELQKRRSDRRLLIGSLFVLSGLLAVTAFLAMRPG